MAKTAMPSTSGGDTIAWLSLLCPPCFFSELHDEHTRTSSALKGSSSSFHSLLAPPPLPAAHISSSSCLRRLRSRRRRRLQLTDPNCNPSPPTSPPPSTSPPPLLSFSLVLSLSPTAPKSSSLGEARPPPPLFPDSPPSSSFPLSPSSSIRLLLPVFPQKCRGASPSLRFIPRLFCA